MGGAYSPFLWGSTSGKLLAEQPYNLPVKVQCLTMLHFLWAVSLLLLFSIPLRAILPFSMLGFLSGTAPHRHASVGCERYVWPLKAPYVSVFLQSPAIRVFKGPSPLLWAKTIGSRTPHLLEKLTIP